MRNSTSWRSSGSTSRIVEDALGEADALVGVVGVLPLADVVQQQRQHQPLGRGHLGEEAGEAAAGARAGEQPFEAADRQQGVLVDGVAVVEVADDAAADPIEAVDQAAEQAAVVHRRQGRVEAAARRQQAHEAPSRGQRRQHVRAAVAAAPALDHGERLGRHRHAVFERQRERLEPRGRIGRRPRWVDEQHRLAGDLEVGADRHRQRLRRRRDADDGRLEGPGHGAGVREPAAHERLDPLLGVGAGEAEALRDPLLQLVAEDVGVAAALEVEQRPHPQHEVLGLLELVLVDRRRVVRQRRQQAGRDDVAQAAGRFLHVGLELVDRVVEGAVAFGGQAEQRLDDVIAGVAGQGGRAAIDALEDQRIAGEQPGVDLGEQELRVVDVDVRGLVEGPHLVADGQAEVPERMEDGLEDALLAAADRAAEDQQQVDVRMQRQGPPAVAAERRDRHRHRRLGQRRADEIPDQVVEAIGEAGVRGAAAGAPLDVDGELSARLGEPFPGRAAIVGGRVHRRAESTAPVAMRIR